MSGELNTQLSEEVIRSKAKIKELEIKLSALITILENEGIVDGADIDAEFESKYH